MRTAAVQTFLVTRSGLKDDLVHAMTKAVFENLPALVAAQAVAKEIDPKTTADNSPVPLHPGAERYFRERGRT